MLKASRTETLKRIAEGSCTVCGISLEGDTVYRTGRRMRTCRKCRKKEAEDQKKLRASRKKRNLCTRCGKRKSRKRLLLCGFCQKGCTLRARQRNSRAFFHKRASSGGSYRYSISFVKMLWSLWKEQRGRCALTGIRLTKENSELDHIIPVSKGGTNERSNLRWLQKDVNQAKRALTDSQFLELCRAVVLYSER